jgi:hypothetical protein
LAIIGFGFRQSSFGVSSQYSLASPTARGVPISSFDFGARVLGAVFTIKKNSSSEIQLRQEESIFELIYKNVVNL